MTIVHPIFYAPYRILRNQIAVGIGTHTAIKLLRYHHHAIGELEKKKIIERMATYNGITVPPPAFRGKPSMHADFGMSPPMIRHTEFSTLCVPENLSYRRLNA